MKKKVRKPGRAFMVARAGPVLICAGAWFSGFDFDRRGGIAGGLFSFSAFIFCVVFAGLYTEWTEEADK